MVLRLRACVILLLLLCGSKVESLLREGEVGCSLLPVAVPLRINARQ